MNPICQSCGEYPCNCNSGINPIYNYRVTFNTIGGNQIDDIINIPHGAKIIKPVDPVRANFSFDAWYKEIEHITKWDFDNDTVTQNTTLYARWITYNCVGFPEHDWEWTANAIQQTCKEPSKDTAICNNIGCNATNERIGSFDPVDCFFNIWATITPARYHLDDNDINMCGTGVEELRCVRYAECGETNGTRFIPCLGTANLVMTGTSVGNNRDLDVTDLCIPDTATSIEGYAFGDIPSTANQNIQRIRIGINVTDIGNRAFRYCENLTTVIFANGSNLNIIQDVAFSDCINLTIITIPTSVTRIGTTVFANCTKINSITIPESVTNIGNAFYNWTSSQTINIPFATIVEANAIWGTDWLTSNNAVIRNNLGEVITP